VEDGTNISDHSRPDPDQVTLSCFVSNTPLSADQQRIADQQTADSPDLVNASGSTSIMELPDRGRRVFDALKKMRDTGALITVVTTLKTYGALADEGMMITSLNVSRNAGNYNGLEFNLTLKQVRIVHNRATALKPNKDKRARKKESKGAQAPKPEDESQLSKDDIKLLGGRGEYVKK
jgi:hypothetical protein